MTTPFIAFLRGINVGKHKRVPMAALRAMLEGMGFGGVKTLLNSGNAIFTTDDILPNEELASRIERELDREFSMEIPVVVRSGSEMGRIVAENPFPHISDHKTLHVEFLAEPLMPDQVDALARLDKGEDDYRVIGNNLYLSYPNKLTGAVFVPKLDVVHTSRNWATVVKVAALTGG